MIFWLFFVKTIAYLIALYYCIKYDRLKIGINKDDIKDPKEIIKEIDDLEV